VKFTVDSSRVADIVSILPSEYRTIYLAAWRDAVASVMEDCGWTFDATAEAETVRVERVRTGRPRVIHGSHIESQLARAIKTVDEALDLSIGGDVELAAVIADARSGQPIAFEWRITENFKPIDGSPERTMQLLGSSYIDLTTPHPAKTS
jgi:hypothetical protein